MPINDPRKREEEDNKNYEINETSGEVDPIIDPDDLTQWSTHKRNQYNQAIKFIEILEERMYNLPEADMEDTRRSLAAFGKNGQKLYERVCAIDKHYDEHKARFQYNEVLDNGEALKTPGKFFKICGILGINMATVREREEKKQDINDLLPEGVDPDDNLKNGFYEHEGSYYSVTKDGPRCVCEFTIRVLYLVQSKTNPKRIVELKNKYGYKSVLDLSTDSFVSLGNFKKSIESVGNYVFEGNDTDLTRLKKKLFREEKPSKEVLRLGWNAKAKFFCWSNGIFNGKFEPTDEYGIVQHAGYNYFIPFMSEINRDDDQVFLNEKKFIYKVNEKANFDNWAKLIHRSYGANGLLGIAYYVAALFRDHIFNINHNFPMLFLFGQRQSGKTTFAQSFKYLFGQPQDSISLENPSSVVGVNRTLSRFYNCLIHLDEYKNSLDKKTVGTIKGIYDGIGRTVGKFSNDDQTNVTKPNSSVIVGGQELPTIDNAMFTRFILLEFTDKKRDHDGFQALMNLQKKGLTNITTDILRHRQSIESYFKEMSLALIKTIKKDMHGTQIEDRMLQNMATILTPLFILIDEGIITMPVSKERIYELSLENMRNQHDKIGKSTDASRFWDIFVALVRSDTLKEGIDYRFLKGHLLVRLGNVHGYYLKEHRNMFGSVGLDRTTIDYYLQNSDYFIQMDKQKFNKPGVYEGPNLKTTTTSCHRFNFAKMDIDLSEKDIEVME